MTRKQLGLALWFVAMGLLGAGLAHACVGQSVQLQADLLYRPVRETGIAWTHRADVGLRWRPCWGRICAQAGGLLVAENPFEIAERQSVLQHYAVDVSYTDPRKLTFSIMAGQFVRTSTELAIDYYRFVAVGAQWAPRPTVQLALEQQVAQFDRSHPISSIHGSRFVGVLGPVTGDATFVTVMGTARTYWTYTLRVAPWRSGPFVQVGRAAFPQHEAGHDLPFRYAALGVQWR